VPGDRQRQQREQAEPDADLGGHLLAEAQRQRADPGVDEGEHGDDDQRLPGADVGDVLADVGRRERRRARLVLRGLQDQRDDRGRGPDERGRDTGRAGQPHHRLGELRPVVADEHGKQREPDRRDRGEVEQHPDDRDAGRDHRAGLHHAGDRGGGGERDADEGAQQTRRHDAQQGRVADLRGGLGLGHLSYCFFSAVSS
jgi:hypothetical protein